MNTFVQWLQERLPPLATKSCKSQPSQQQQQHQQVKQQQELQQVMLLQASPASKVASIPSLLPAQSLTPLERQQSTQPMQTSHAAQADTFTGAGPLSCNVITHSSSQSSNLTHSAVSSSISFRGSSKTGTSNSSSSSSSGRQKLSRVADKLSFKVVLDSNSGSCATELCWHMRTEQQRAKLAVKLSNRNQTRISFDAQVALRWG
jgi:hypothetical protein